MDAWRSRPGMPPLKIIGDGPEASWLRQQIASLPNIEWLGRLPREQVLTYMQNAKALILPSIWYENFPVTIVEAFATGLPVIVSDAGTLPELVRDGVSGFVFRSGDAADLAGKVDRMQSDARSHGAMKLATRALFESSYTQDRNLLLLMSIYESALANFRKS
jgi:glycosyltransferase involved in cell wall biosynthesis